MSEADTIAQGVVAWRRIKTNARTSWGEWVLTAKALAAGRAQAMQEAKTNTPMGTKYNTAMGAWLREHGFDGIDNQQRYRALLCLENFEAIEAFRATLPETKRDRLNHPNAIWSHFRRATRPASAPKRRRASAAKPAPIRRQIAERAKAVALAARHGKAVFWGQDHLRRAHRAMLDSRSTDLLTLARLALQAAIRNEDDLLALLEEEPRSLPGDAVAHAAA